MVEDILKTGSDVHCMRDATRGGLGAILAEISEQSQCRITIEEGDIPIKDEVRGICEILGLDPLYIANEGKMVVICARDNADAVLSTMMSNEFGKQAAVIGRVGDKGNGRLVMNTIIGGSRQVDLPSGELVPRIC